MSRLELKHGATQGEYIVQENLTEWHRLEATPVRSSIHFDEHIPRFPELADLQGAVSMDKVLYLLPCIWRERRASQDGSTDDGCIYLRGEILHFGAIEPQALGPSLAHSEDHDSCSPNAARTGIEDFVQDFVVESSDSLRKECPLCQSVSKKSTL